MPTKGGGKSHALIAFGHAAVEQGLRVRDSTAAELVENLYRGLADNSVGKVIETLSATTSSSATRWLRAAGQHRQPADFRFVAAAYERRSLAIASHWPFEEWGRFLPDHSTAVSLLDRLLHHNNVVATDGESYRMREARKPLRRPPLDELTHHARWGLSLATSGDRQMAIDSVLSISLRRRTVAFTTDRPSQRRRRPSPDVSR